MKKNITKLGIASLLVLPHFTFAQTPTNNLKDLISLVIYYMNYAVIFIMGLAILLFVWNIFKYFIYSTDSTKKSEAGLYVMWSVIGFFVILSFWGLVNILTGTLKLNSQQPSTFFGGYSSSYSNQNSSNSPFGGTNSGTNNYSTGGTNSGTKSWW